MTPIPKARPVSVTPVPPPVSTGTMLGIIVTTVVALYFGRDILLPVVLAILLSFALAPIVVRLRRLGLGRVPSVIGVVALVFIVVLGFGTVIAMQLVDLTENLPSYEQNIRAKIHSLQGAMAGSGVVDQASEIVRDLSQELEEATRQPEGIEGQVRPGGDISVVAPIPVEIHQPRPTPLNELQNLLGPLMAPIGTAGIVLVFVIFMLLQREDLRNRLIRLAGSDDLHRTTEAMNEAASRVSRYLLMQLLINVLYGVPVAIGLFFIGVPNPILWGLLATFLRFIPYVGPVIAATFPIILSFAVSPGWTEPLLTVGLFLALELFSNNVLEPWLYGSSTGLSPVAIITAAIFWTVLWGPVGLLLATPLTVCFVVLGKHVPQLQFLDVMLGNQPVLPPEAKVYQRLLARDPDEAVELAEEALKDKPLAEMYDTLLMPALALAEQDRQRRALDSATQSAIAEGIGTIIEEFTDHVDPPEETTGAPVSGRVLCIAVRNSLDEAAALLLAHLLSRRGLAAEVVPCDAVSPRNLPGLNREDVAMVCLSSINPNAIQQTSRLVRRLRQHFRRDIPVAVGLWNAEESTNLAAATGAEHAFTGLRESADLIQTAFSTSDQAAAQ